MSTNYPSGIDTTGTGGTLNVQASTTPLSTGHVSSHQNLSDSVIALETKVGVDSSAVTSTIDYKLKNVASIDPGHKHTPSVSLVTTGTPSAATVLFGDNSWGAPPTSADASTTVKGLTKLSVAPASPTSPIAVGDNDTRVPTQGENDALVGNNTDVAVGTGNKFVTQTGLQHSAETYAIDAVGTDSYAVTLSPVPTSYTAGMTVRFKAGTANTGACSLNVNSLGAKTIKRADSNDTITGDIISGQIVEVAYDGTNFQLLSVSSVFNTYATGVPSDLSTTSLANNDVTITTGFQPRLIRLHYFLQGHDRTTDANAFFGIKGIAMYTGTTLVSDFRIWGDTGNLGQGYALTGDNGTPSAFVSASNVNSPNSTAAPVAGIAPGSGTGGIQITLSVPTVTSTGFTIRRLTDSTSSSPQTARCKIYYEAFA